MATDLENELDEAFDQFLDQDNQKRMWKLYDEIVMLLATELGLDINELTRPIVEADEGWTFLLDDLVAKAWPIKNQHVLDLLREYQELERPFTDVIAAHMDDDGGARHA